MALISLRDLSIRFRGPALLDGVDCEIESGQHIGLLGRNGAGKSTLMKILVGQQQPDSGHVVLAPGAKVGMLQQEVPTETTGTIGQEVIKGLENDERFADWEKERQRDKILNKMGLDAEAEYGSLSSGMKRRVLLAKALAPEPEVLLLDEPTNHLDVDTITWLENFLSAWKGTLIFVTHDRSFLQKLSNRILEIDRGKIFDWQCDYNTFLERKEAALDAEEKQNALFDKKLAEEEAWIRQGVKARRTRNMGRVRALKAMREDRKDRREKVGKVNLKIDSGQKSGQLVAAVKDVSFAYDEKIIFQNFSTMIMRGDKVGVIGKNGAGKTTLLKVLLGKLKPQNGAVKSGTNLQIAYFDQLRGQLDEEESVQHNVGDGYDNIEIAGSKKHILGYLADFLFSPERARTQVKFLSGGERNRVLLAKLFAKPANVIVLDEPTNDLDAESLEMLEQKLVEYSGTVLLVSHDRTFLNNVVTTTLAFGPTGVKEFDGGYDDWLRQSEGERKEQQRLEAEQKKKESASQKKEKPKSAAKSGVSKRKLKFTERKELEKLPGQIETLEAQIEQAHAEMAAPEFFKLPGPNIAKVQQQAAQLQTDLDQLYARWEELEALVD